MLFVNYGGGRYWIFEHTTWNGLNIADIVFPWFAWIMGVCITLSVRSQLRNCSSRWQVFTHSFHRCLVLISLGLILNSKTTNDLSKLRIPGVLQRLGFSYFIVTWLECLFMRPQNAIVRWLTVFQDIISSWVQWLVMLVIVGIHFLLTLYLPAGNCPPGYLGPGGLHDHGKFSHCTGGATGYIDRMIFGPNHLYINSTPVKTYETTVPFDPEGILGLLTTSFTVFLGVQAGRILSHYSCSKARIQRWLVWSLICGILGGCLCGWTTEGGLIPINKNLWSLSFVFVTASLAFLALTVLFIIIEHLQWWSGAPFQQCGKNSIFIYVVSQLVKDMLPWTWKPFGDGSSHTEFLIMDSWATSLWILIAVILDIYEIYFII
ncbi:hypothetical protein AAG570_006507 [Ranatra chinensis]|uniref:Heparan-alpha-glucosaminide N-acetyltransferase n=1 Tax=Ranatra chinensis TaxID=642074 RepID=A0ABD0YU81_9HEMI